MGRAERRRKALGKGKCTGCGRLLKLKDGRCQCCRHGVSEWTAAEWMAEDGTKVVADIGRG